LAAKGAKFLGTNAVKALSGVERGRELDALAAKGAKFLGVNAVKALS